MLATSRSKDVGLLVRRYVIGLHESFDARDHGRGAARGYASVKSLEQPSMAGDLRTVALPKGNSREADESLVHRGSILDLPAMPSVR